jgi:HEAT repeat protein
VARITEALGVAAKAGAGAESMAPAIEEMLRRGAPKDLAKRGLEALGALGSRSSSAVVRTYLGHRDADLRQAAVRALANTKGPEAVEGFKEGLRASDPVVRGFSASGLGTLGAAPALPDLFLALDHNVKEAAAAIGRLCVAADCERFAAKLGSIPLDVMTTGLELILFREAPLPDDALLGIVGKLGGLHTPEADKYLNDVQARWPAGASAKVKQALISAASRTPTPGGSSGG